MECRKSYDEEFLYLYTAFIVTLIKSKRLGQEVLFTREILRKEAAGELKFT